jgi:hypothetical protein
MSWSWTWYAYQIPKYFTQKISNALTSVSSLNASQCCICDHHKCTYCIVSYLVYAKYLLAHSFARLVSYDHLF